MIDRVCLCGLPWPTCRFPWRSRALWHLCDQAKRCASTLVLLILALPASAEDGNPSDSQTVFRNRLHSSEMLEDYFLELSQPIPTKVRTGEELAAYQRDLREKVLAALGLSPLPECVPLYPHYSESLDHEWCTVQRVAYQIWPGVYADGLLYKPKHLRERPGPAVLCPHGHWPHGNAHPDVQTRCLVLASPRYGYTVFSPTQNHYEDLNLGISIQTVMVWSDMRALDFLETLPEVDPGRIGSAGCSGGGSQTQVLAALDPRVKAAVVAGLTCNYENILSPDSGHCACNHWPNAMRFMDFPELAVLAFPAWVHYLTMNDWTRSFERENFPAIQELYRANGYAQRVETLYEPTQHIYNRSKREQTYWWMERALMGCCCLEPIPEPENVVTFPVETIENLTVEGPKIAEFGGVSDSYAERTLYTAPVISAEDDWLRYRKRMTETLTELIGLNGELPSRVLRPEALSTIVRDGMLIDTVNCPSEGGLRIPTLLVRRKGAEGRLPIVLMLGPDGKDALLEADIPYGPLAYARDGALVVLPDVRFVGELSLMDRQGHTPYGWRRASILWGRPFPGMACTDVRRVLDYVATCPEADMRSVKVVSRDSGPLASGLLFAAALDARITEADLDFDHCCFKLRNRAPIPWRHVDDTIRPNLPDVPFILRHGDVLQWAALLADRTLTLRNVHGEAGDPAWLSQTFAVLGNNKAFTLR